MGLQLKDSETFGYLAKERDIQIATKMYLGGYRKEEVIYFTELTEQEFEDEIIKKLEKEKGSVK